MKREKKTHIDSSALDWAHANNHTHARSISNALRSPTWEVINFQTHLCGAKPNDQMIESIFSRIAMAFQNEIEHYKMPDHFRPGKRFQEN